ncbi:MAG: helix-turn-helix transcriptional regulator [Clostridia bacterium]|nr:helix-turn-helix transcriptional regulator [Clostridia bacterium]
MDVFFETCSLAEKNALENKSYGVFYSETKNHNQNVHVHECCELFLCLEGGSSFLIDDEFYEISNGDLFVMNQFEAHKVAPDKSEKFIRYIMHIHPAFLYDVSGDDTNLAGCFYAAGRPNKVSLTKEQTQHLIDLFESLRRTEVYGDSMYKRLRVTEILLQTNQFFSLNNKPDPEDVSHKTINLIINYINDNFAKELTLEDVAKNAFISVNQLCRIFNKYCSTTVTKYIISKRIAEAKKLLAEGTSVTNTAYLCGFNDYANFIKTFKKTVGVSPGKYKLQFK